MKALKITIIALLAGFSMVSCDFLDKEPTKLTPENYFNTPAEANSFLTGIYAILSQPTFYGGDYMYLVAGDDLSHYGGSGRGPASTGLICNNATTSDNAVTAFWYALYSGINRANMFLENIDKVNGFDAGVKEQYIAEARFLRAFYYFNLVECWGDVPFKTVSTQSVTNLNIPRTDKQEIYDFIISEMADAAETGLKSASDLAYKPGRISQSTAWGILARVYLFRAGEHYREGRNATQAEKKDYFERASFYAQKVMTAGLGTVATRTGILQTLIDRKYVRYSGGYIIPTRKGLYIYETVRGMKIADPALTSGWETQLAGMEQGKLTQEEFLEGALKLAGEVTEEIFRKYQK